MGKTIRGWWMGRDKSTKKKPDRKSFVHPGEISYTHAMGGPGNKRGWKNYIPKFILQKYKDQHK